MSPAAGPQAVACYPRAPSRRGERSAGDLSSGPMYALVTRDRPARRWAAVLATAILLAAALAAAQALRWYKLTDRFGALTTAFTCQPGGVKLFLPADWQQLAASADAPSGVVGRFARGDEPEAHRLTVFYRPHHASFSFQAASTLTEQVLPAPGPGPRASISAAGGQRLGPMLATRISGSVTTRQGVNYFALLAAQLPNDYALGLLLESPASSQGLRSFLERVAEQVSLPELALQRGPADVTLQGLRFSLPAGLLAYLPEGPTGRTAKLCGRPGQGEMAITLYTTWLGPDREPADIVADAYRDAYYQVALPQPVEGAPFGQHSGLVIADEAGGQSRQVCGVADGQVMAAVVAASPSEVRPALRQAVEDLLTDAQLQPLDFDLDAALQAGQETMEQLLRMDPAETWARRDAHYFRVEYLDGGEGIESRHLGPASPTARSPSEGQEGFLVKLPNATYSGQTEWWMDESTLGFREETTTVAEFGGQRPITVRHEANDSQTARGEPVSCRRARHETGEPPQEVRAEWSPHEAFLPYPMEDWAYFLVASGRVDSPALLQSSQFRSPQPCWQLVRALGSTRVATDLRGSPHDAMGVEVLYDYRGEPLRAYFDEDGKLLRYEVGTQAVIIRTSQRKFEAAEGRLRDAGWGRWFDRR